MHIRQKIDVTNRNTDIAYTVVITTDWTFPLEQHPSVVEHPDLFEISIDEIPNNAQYLKYN